MLKYFQTAPWCLQGLVNASLYMMILCTQTSAYVNGFFFIQFRALTMAKWIEERFFVRTYICLSKYYIEYITFICLCKPLKVDVVYQIFLCITYQRNQIPYWRKVLPRSFSLLNLASIIVYSPRLSWLCQIETMLKKTVQPQSVVVLSLPILD